MENNRLDEILTQVSDGTLTVDKAKGMLASFEDLGFAKIDHRREHRTGFPEIIYGEGKDAAQMIEIIRSLQQNTNRVLATRVDQEKADQIKEAIPELIYNSKAKTVYWKNETEPVLLYKGYIAVVCAGTSDIEVAEEAAVTAEAFGVNVRRIYDVGVAGIHRLFHHLEEIEQATVTIVVAGMEGALPSVIGGLISNPIVAVPTSVGYGANFQGLSALLTMLNSCASGVSVMNIDNGFGAGYFATMIHKNHRHTKA
ncbi:nickel pincer cofactor biosynthesis protein LarB [Bacillaceae bacterium IKA-2]|nr:nickel pincer cofactor biosynthesis protein LarB [Bacillaceae bacterium IKA-2]